MLASQILIQNKTALLERTQKLFEANSCAEQIGSICKSLNHSEILIKKQQKR